MIDLEPYRENPFLEDLKELGTRRMHNDPPPNATIGDMWWELGTGELWMYSEFGWVKSK